MKSIDELCINTLRMLSVDMVEAANSGHPGLPMGAAAAAYTLWTRHIKHDPADPNWPDRDRFVLSAGHGSALLYSLLHLSGYDLSIEDLKSFRQMGSKTPGHPERGVTPGVEVTTGPLGQGFANGVGMAIAERHLASRFNRPGREIVNHRTYAIVSDGDLMEGISSEAASLAGHLKLSKLIYLYDANDICLSGGCGLSFTENVSRRFAAYNWHVVDVADGNDVEAIDEAINMAKEETERPSLVIVHTRIGFGSPNKENSHEAHGAPLGPEERSLTRKSLGWPDEDFHVPEEAASVFRGAAELSALARHAWNNNLSEYFTEHPDMKPAWETDVSGDMPEGWEDELPVFRPGDRDIATRSASGKVINALADVMPSLMGGAADLEPSVKTVMGGQGSFQPDGESGSPDGTPDGVWGYGGRNISYGVREHAMGGIMNGMAAHGGLVPFGGTFLVFSDYMRPSIRLASLMSLRVIYVFTHDSIGVGEDGPTHQPVEQLMALRAIPGLTVIRPADAKETVYAWKSALLSDGPTALILSRQKLAVQENTGEGALLGGYVISGSGDKADAVIIATGSEVGPALKAASLLKEDGINVRVVSMPSWELFESRPDSYKHDVLPDGIKARVSVEAGVGTGWERYAVSREGVLSVDRFGTSAPGAEIFREYGITPEAVAERVRSILKK